VIDGVKIIFYSESVVNDLLRLGVEPEAKVKIDSTGEMIFPKFAEYQNLRFKISESKRVEITGSLHKYWKGENYSNFTFSELKRSITDLCLKLNINPLKAYLGGFEFGVNVSPQFNPFEFCENVIAYKNESFSKFRANKKIQIGFEAQKQQYSVKVYDKGKQYLKEDNILRFEIKVLKMEFLKRINISRLGDLTKPEVLIQLGELLNEMFGECIVSDKVRTSDLTANESKIYTLCSNPKVWEKFDFRTRYKKRKQFERIIETKGVNKWKGITARMIRDKWNLLYSFNPKSVENLTDLLKGQKGEFNRLDKGLIYRTSDLPEKRFCKSCGRDISNQRKGSVFCSQKFVGEQKAKQCRNIDSNPRNISKGRVKEFLKPSLKKRIGSGSPFF
jgi:hypothetical protein